MMLTNRTAKFLNVKDRVDPYESINGGTLYLRDLIDRVPATVEKPDRTWMALAAYNVGMGHLEDARVITAKQGGNPNIWQDVRERLPLLAKPAWYRKTRHGYARGYEPVQYVRRIRTYFDILVKVDEDIKATNSTEAIKVEPSAL
jgi:membrane-bound lytic murein transglycosylase F